MREGLEIKSKICPLGAAISQSKENNQKMLALPHYRELEH